MYSQTGCDRQEAWVHLAERYRGRGIGGLITAPTLAADPVPQNDLLNAELWMQTAIEYRANCFMVYALAKVRLDEVLADRNWTAYDQSGSYQNFPRPERRSADVRSEGGRFRHDAQRILLRHA